MLARKTQLVAECPEQRPKRPRRSTPHYLTLDDLSVEPLVCVNCFGLVDAFRAYCRELCSQEAEFVRYARRRIREGRRHDHAIDEALRIKLAHILAGGYPRKHPVLPPTVRAGACERDSGRCRECGAAR